MISHIKESAIDIVVAPFFIGMRFLSWAGANILYLQWRLSGGVRHFLKESGQDTLWKALGLENPHITQLAQSGTYWIREPQWFREVDHVKYARLAEYVDLFQTKSDRIQGASMRIIPAYITFNWLFTVNPSKLRFGCHGKYTLPKALFVGKRFGGDLRCGGGIKHFFPPFFRACLEYIRFWQTIKTQSFSAYVRDSEYGNCVTFVNPESGGISEVFLDIFFGDKKVIDNYLREKHETTALPLPIHVQVI